MLGGELLGLLGEPRNVRLLEVVGRRLHELRLSARRRSLPARKIEIGQRQIGLEPARRRIEGPARDAHALRLRPQHLRATSGTSGSAAAMAGTAADAHSERQGGSTHPQSHASLDSSHRPTRVSTAPSCRPRHRSLATIRPPPALTGTAKSAEDMEFAMLQVPLEIAFHNIASSDWAEQEIRARVADLEKLYDRLDFLPDADRPARQGPHRHDPAGRAYRARHSRPRRPRRQPRARPPAAEISNTPTCTMPSTRRSASPSGSSLTSRSSATTATRTVITIPSNQSLGQVAEITPEQDFGFLITKEGGLLYFHRNAMLSAISTISSAATRSTISRRSATPARSRPRCA